MSKPVFVADFTDIGEPKSPSRASWTLWYILLGLLLPFTVLTYLAGLFAQVVPLPFRRGEQAVRLTLWSIGWLVCCWADPPRSCTRCPESPRTFPVRSLYCRVGDPFRPVAGGGHGSTLCLLGVL
jgi:hypothetical protein